MLTVPMARVSSTRMAMSAVTRRRRSGQWRKARARSLIGGPDGVAHPAQRVDHRRAGGVELLAKVGEGGVQHARLAAESGDPHPVADLGLAQHLVGVQL